ncbi:MAG: type II CAAX endopeptidase family protein [Cyanobacteria bacterium J06638_22]
MTIKRLILSLLTLVVVALVGSSLITSLGQPQITNRLELYQTNLVLLATETVPQSETAEIAADADPIDPMNTARSQLQLAVLGNDPLQMALENYQSVRDDAQDTLTNFEIRMAESDSAQLSTLVPQQEALLWQLDLRIGLLQAVQGNLDAAQMIWDTLLSQLERRTAAVSAIAETAAILSDLWGEPPTVGENAETVVRTNLEGWFQDEALTQLYTATGNDTALAALETQRIAIARTTLLKLALVGILPAIAAIAGIGLVIFLLVQRFTQGKEALLAVGGQAWETPWEAEIIWQVLIVGFFLIGQVVLPLLLSLLPLSLADSTSRVRAFYTLGYYVTMATAGLFILFLSVRAYRPLPKDWFRFQLSGRGLLWGVGGYLAALPLMLGVSIVNQQIWQGQGGSNPLLQIVLEENDPVALGIFLFTAAVAAPVFEELLFRGFLLPSLTRYFPVWGAIALSGLVFAIAHLSLSEVIPLALLGSVLGIVYVRSRNLLAPMLLHSLWNSITMIGLFILGSGS